LEIRKTNKISLQDIEYSNYFRVAKNNEYLNWRYERNSKNKYEYFEILKDKNIIGYIIYKNNKIKYEVIDLLLNNAMQNYTTAIKSLAGFSLKQGKYSFHILISKISSGMILSRLFIRTKLASISHKNSGY